MTSITKFPRDFANLELKGETSVGNFKLNHRIFRQIKELCGTIYQVSLEDQI